MFIRVVGDKHSGVVHMNARDPLVTVLMPVYNAHRFLKEAVESILQQSYRDFKFIIVDDCSTDSSYELLEKYRDSDARIKLLRNEKNRGITYSLNKGLKHSVGTYVVRMDADDISMSARIEKQVRWMDEHPDVGVLGSALKYIDVDGTMFDRVRYCALGGGNLVESPLLHPTVIIRKQVLDTYGLCYREKFDTSQDYYLWLELSRVTQIDALDEVLVLYRISQQVTRIKRLKRVLYNTLRIKYEAIFSLKIKVNLRVVIRMIAECMLLLLPARIVVKIYIWKMFRKGAIAEL